MMIAKLEGTLNTALQNKDTMQTGSNKQQKNHHLRTDSRRIHWGGLGGVGKQVWTDRAAILRILDKYPTYEPVQQID